MLSPYEVLGVRGDRWVIRQVKEGGWLGAWHSADSELQGAEAPGRMLRPSMFWLWELGIFGGRAKSISLPINSMDQGNLSACLYFAS